MSAIIEFGLVGGWRRNLHFLHMSDKELKKTPLNAAHRALGGRIVDFGGWDMPVL